MILNINIDQEYFQLDVPDGLMTELAPIMSDMDKDFDNGIQMGRFWIDNPSDEQRCQLAANNLVNAMHAENKRMLYLMSAYILNKFPTVQEVMVNSDYEMQDIDIRL
ncbi:MAG: hypothetical protein OEY87_04290 [Gammaproteobacteria bacterium]|nr:hypothetical protein [Gammaproteobacteria bacterium]